MSVHWIGSGRFGAAAAGYGFTPTDLSGLKIWWRAENVNLSGTAISNWTDQSGNGNHGSWTGGRADQDAAIVGSLPAAHFTTGANYQMPSGAMSGVTNAQIFAALKTTLDPPAVGDPNGGLWNWSLSGAASTHYPFSDSNVYDGFGSATRFTIGNPASTLSNWHRLSVKAEPAGYELWVNNTSVFNNATSCGTDWVAVPQFGTGKAADVTFRGYLLEMIVYARVLSASDRSQVDRYLSDRIDGTWYAAEHP